ncbi:hypothetical protein MMC12_006427, partial [Toensbergia leucococca]|nr:hypothetical protein [Toensbergia leucococca]
FSLSLELANLAHLFPVRAGIAYTTESIITWARELKRTGSDFLVEEDLAVVFGRARIVPLLENHFRDVVKISSFVPLSGDSEIVLDAGPGPTLRRALKDARYMATVIQLSFLAWMHEETTLAAALTESMLTRYDQRVQNATSDPDYEGILGTLRACISQTSQFPWEMLMSLVESKFPKSVAWFHIIGSPLKILSPNLLLGAMDYLYLVQSLPEDRIIVVDNQMGLVPIVVWGYCILGLTVLVKGSPDGDVAFGREEGPQIIINWSREWEMHMWSWEAKNTSVPVISLLDGDMEVLLSTKPDDSETVEIEGQEIHRLEGYGTTFLRGLFNMDSIIADDHPIYAESVQHLIAFAIVMLKSTRRVPFPGVSDPRKQPEVPEQCYMKVENIRLIASSEALFSGITFDKKEINGYVEKLTGIELGNLPLPPTIRSHLDNGGKKDKRYNNHGVDGSLKILASMIITFA